MTADFIDFADGRGISGRRKESADFADGRKSERSWRRPLTNRTDLTTVTITAREERDYVPPAAPTFLTRVEQSWAGSLDALRGFGENVGLAIVAVTPWVAILAVVVGPLVWWKRRRSARVAAARGTATGE